MPASKMIIQIDDRNNLIQLAWAMVLNKINRKRAIEFYMSRIYWRIDGGKWKLLK